MERYCTIEDARRMHRQDPTGLPPASDVLIPYLESLADGQWHSMADLRKDGFDSFSYFEELHIRGMADGVIAPYRVTRKKSYGCIYWFRITDQGASFLRSKQPLNAGVGKMLDIPAQLETHRVKHGLSYTEIGRRLGVSRQYVSGVLRGQLTASTDQLTRIAEAMGCTIKTRVVRR